MNWKIATALVAVAMGLLFAMLATDAHGAERKYPAGYRCQPRVLIKCWGPGRVPDWFPPRPAPVVRPPHGTR